MKAARLSTGGVSRQGQRSGSGGEARSRVTPGQGQVPEHAGAGQKKGRSQRARYVRAEFITPFELADEAAGLLMAQGAIGCAVGEPIKPGKRPPKTARLQAYFEKLTSARLARLAKLMAAAGMLAKVEASAVPTLERITDPGWSTMWKSRFRPFRVGQRMLIAPPWDVPDNSSRLKIVIQPGQAFGTGHHATTRSVLRAMEELFSVRKFADVLDVGTGSGLLAIAAVKLGAARVNAVEIDPAALENARENLQINGVDRRVHLSDAPLTALRRRFDLIVANILSSTLIELAPSFKRLLAADGVLILAGILRKEAPEVLRHFRPEMRPVRILQDREWSTLVMGR